MKKILITGGGGFIGFHLAKKFLEKNYKVDLIDNFSRSFLDFDLKNLINNKNIKLIKSDLLRLNSKKCGSDYDKIFHLAAIIGVRHVNKNPYKVLTHNIRLLENVIQIAKKQKNLSNFVFFSTSEVYSGTLRYHGLKIPTPENTPLTIDNMNFSRTSYMASKIYGELMCNMSKNLPYTIIRPHNFYGPRMGFSHVIPEIMLKIFNSQNKKIKVESPNHRRTFCYIDDAVDMIFDLVKTKKSLYKTFNIGSFENSIDIYQLAKKILKTSGFKINIKKSYTEKGSPSKRRPNMNQFKKIVRFKCKYNLDKGLKETYNWYLNNIFLNKKKTFI